MLGALERGEPARAQAALKTAGVLRRGAGASSKPPGDVPVLRPGRAPHVVKVVEFGRRGAVLELDLHAVSPAATSGSRRLSPRRVHYAWPASPIRAKPWQDGTPGTSRFEQGVNAAAGSLRGETRPPRTRRLGAYSHSMVAGGFELTS